MTSILIKLVIDDSKFYLSLNNLKKYKNSLLFDILSNKQINDRVIYDDGYFYIDADKDSFSWIILFLRGYPMDCNNLSSEIKKKIYFDAKYFKLFDICNKLDNNELDNLDKPDNKHEINNTTNNQTDSLLTVNDTNNISIDNVSTFSEINNKYGGSLPIINEINNKHEINILDRYSEDSEDNSSSDIDYENTKLEDMLELEEDEKELFDKQLAEEQELRSKIEKELDKTKDLPKTLDTSVLLTDNKTKIDELINTIQEKLASEDAPMMINCISNDQNICNAVKVFNRRYELFKDDDEDDEDDEDDDNNIKYLNQKKVYTKYVKI